MDVTQISTPVPGTLSVADEAATARLRDLLDAELAFDPIARGGYINHLAMSLVAAWRLGADAAELDAWFRVQTSGDFLVPRPRPEWLDADAQRIERRGLAVEVRDRLPALVSSPGTQFFHAIIRLEHALDSGHAGQVANALRNWEDHADESRERPNDADARASTEVLEAVAHDAVRFYLARPDIGTLHLVTGTRAARSLVALLDEPSARALAFATADSVADRAGTHVPVLVDPDTAADPAAGLPDWATVARAALDSHDPHVVKLVHSAHWEHERTGDPLRRRAAATAVGLV